MYGIEIAKQIKDMSENTYDLKKPTLYGALRRLEKSGLIKIVRTEDSPIGGARQFYGLTEAGQEVLNNKKFDWVYSKLLIDNLVLDKNIIKEDVVEVVEKVAVELPVVAKASAVAEVASEVAVGNVRTMIRTITPMEEYAAQSGGYINLPLRHPKETVAAQKMDVFFGTTPSAPRQIGVDLQKVDSIDVATEPVYKPFVKHYGHKSDRFVFANAVRLSAAFLVTAVLCAALGIVYAAAKPAYTSAELNIFTLGWVAAGFYLFTNMAIFAACPTHKRVVGPMSHTLIARGVISACLVVGALSINLVAGLSNVNSADYLVSCVVPCLVAAIAILEPLGVLVLRRVRTFLA